MNQNPVAEINSYLDHDDHSLAIRRILDISLDTDDPSLIDEAIALSRQWTIIKDVKDEDPQKKEFGEKARHLLGRIAVKISARKDPELLIAADQVSKTYTSGNFTLKPSSLEISTGDIVGIVGENGSGKTTLLRCMAGQLAIDSGIITYTQIKDPGYYSIKSHVAFIPQRIPRWYGFLKDNLHFSAAIVGIHGERNLRMVNFMLERLGLSGYSHLTWNQISSGYRTRFEIARVLLQRPTLLILDEPLANLDINAQQTILNDLKFMAKSANHPMGVILSSQQLHEVEKIADNVLFIKNGACMYQMKDEIKKTQSYALEVETNAEREAIINLFNGEVSVHYNGGFYTLMSDRLSSQQMIEKLTSGKINISYFRDITYSTKRFFK
jgi:ABC-2 type transport system ATP-binding protein